jgi:uncharacterized membrane protein (DUF373 family)
VRRGRRGRVRAHRACRADRPHERRLSATGRTEAALERPGDDAPAYARFGSALLLVVEDVIYVAIAGLLAVAAGVLLVDALLGFRSIGDDGASSVVLEILDRLLLVFIVVELLFAVRVTLRKREIIAEPFLIVGIIASIKEIIVLSVRAADYIGKGERFDHALREVAVLGVLVIVLAGAAVLLRVKEREPEES